MALEINITKSDLSTYRVGLNGKLDSETWSQLDRRMDEPLGDPKTRTIRLELQQLSFISSAGLGLIAKIRKAMTDRGGVMVVIGAQPQIAKVFDIVKMLPRETIFTSVAEADAYLAAIQKKVIEEGGN